ncbi:MAG TPA: hypothetical protein VNZ44_04705 [Pyrinomonadaceae bacterium]|nr:hypothetical protein [Pyrinomonadaceae bacterium]
MAELIQTYTEVVRDARGVEFVASAHGGERDDGTWEGWIEFRSIAGEGDVRRTGRETTQPNRDALRYWASGLEHVFLEGAFARAS